MKSFLIIGLGSFGRHLTKKLMEHGNEVMVLDIDEERVVDIAPIATAAYVGDCQDEQVLASLGVPNFDVCFVCVRDDLQSSLEATSTLKELGAKMVVSRAATDVQEKFLLRNGADEVVYPEKQLARWAAIRYSADHVLDYIELDSENAIFEVTIPKNWMGKTVGQLDIRKKYSINILAMKCGSKLDSFITPDTLLCEGKSLMVMGKYKDIQKCFRI